VYGIVKQHGGSIDVKSNMGEGTVFTIYLPRLMSAFVKPTSDQVDVTTLTGTETILLVEDNEAMRLSVMDSLAELGYHVIAVENGKEALDTLRRDTAVSLLLTDYIMPVMGGLDLCHSVHKLYPHIKAVLMTGYPLGQEKTSLREDGIADWIEKPFSIEALAGKVRKVLDEPNSLAKKRL
jgi:CheY-like chemotaxis protein